MIRKEGKMTSRRIVVLLMLLVMVMLVGCEEKPAPIKIQIMEKYNPVFGFTYINADITSMTDSITVSGVKWNKGACKLPADFEPWTRTLAYGEKISVAPPDNCNVVRVDVTTDQGTWSMETK